MPELPEVETTRRGLAPRITGARVTELVVRNGALRWPVPKTLPRTVAGRTVRGVGRRGKYLLFDCISTGGDSGTLIVHLGMSGRLWVVDRATPAALHDHVDLVLDNGIVVRLRDPRRFGLVLWQAGDPLRHRLLAAIGPEPLSDAFDGAALQRATRNRKSAIKLVIMDSHVVAGVGNIYASEALFRAGIRPRKAAARLTRRECDALAASIKETLAAAIRAGGSSLRDYVDSDGMAGNFQNQFLVYDRAGAPCTRCKTPIREIRQGQRSTFFCAACQR